MQHSSGANPSSMRSWAALAGASILALSTAQMAAAQDTPPAMALEDDEVIATGIIQSLENALIEKRQSDNLIEVIQAEDIGKLPDQNLAEVLENITGIQITRTAGVGTAVQIRGTDANRTEINGVSTVSSGFGRTGISFEDLPASLISSVEVQKVPEAKTIEGSVGGTINLRTLRPLELDDRVLAFRAQVEQSDLADTVTPRFSGTVGNNWSNAKGQELGLVFSGSYAQQDVAFFNPRADRDAVVAANSSTGSAEDFDFLRIQFFQQNLDNFEYDTLNLSGTLEYAPNPDTRFYVDTLFNDQERRQESYTLDLSGVSAGGVVDTTVNTAFETIDFGTIDGPNGDIQLPTVQAALSGLLIPNTSGSLNPNLRVSTATGARVTESAVFATGVDWDRGRWGGKFEISTASSDTDSPNFRPRLEFNNPNAQQPDGSRDADNGVPVVFDLSDETLQFGIATGVDTSPTTEQLLDPANYQLGRLTFSNSNAENRESALRADFNYDLEDSLPFLTSIDAGYRFNKITSERNSSLSSANFGNDLNRPTADQFAGVIIAGPDNFDAADDRTLFIRDYLAVDPELAFEDPGAIVSAFNAAIIANNANPNPDLRRPILPLVQTPSETSTAFFDISEETHALYAQANFDGAGSNIPLRGNLGLRWIDTSIDSIGNSVAQGQVTQTETSASYDFFLPRFNAVYEASEDLLFRAGVARDIRRPGFTQLSTSVSFGTGSNSVIALGNPALVPESVWSYDVSAEYYFSPSSVISVGLFHKDRTNLFTDIQEDPPGNLDENNQLNIDITPPCEAGGIFNPIADRNINNPNPGVGICVPFRTQQNGEGSFTQTGVEVALQFDLSSFEDRIGFASGFGFIGNYTYQKPGGDAQDFASNFRRIGGNRNVFGVLGVEDPLQQIVQPNLSENTYNATVFYEKYGLSARARYTWRSEYSLPASVESFKVGAPLINADRGQLNASVSYDINDNIAVGVEGINLLQNEQQQFCVSEGTLLCFNGYTDRRLIAGLSVKF